MRRGRRRPRPRALAYECLLRKMTPRFVVHDFANVLGIHVEQPGHIGRAHPRAQPTDSPDVVSGQFCCAGAFASIGNTIAGCQAMTRFRVLNVVPLRTKMEMLGSHTDADIAVMEHKQVLGNGTVSVVPREPMGANEVPATGQLDSAVAFAIYGAQPEPARIGLLHLFPESLRQRPTHWHGRNV